MSSRNTGDWTEQRVEWLKRLWVEGYSCSVIAAEMGGITRNAVIGKVTRLGLPLRKTLKDRRPRGERWKKTHSYRLNRRRLDNFLAREFVHIEEAAKAPDHLGLLFGELKGNQSQCRFIHGDNEATPYTFCGQPVQEGSSYCGFHHRLCYVRPDPKPRKTSTAERRAA